MTHRIEGDDLANLARALAGHLVDDLVVERVGQGVLGVGELGELGEGVCRGSGSASARNERDAEADVEEMDALCRAKRPA